jgi:D-alanine-D-alanine ligase
MGLKSCRLIQAVLARHYTSAIITPVSTLADLADVVARAPDLVVLGMKKVPAADNSADTIWVSAYLDEHDIVYTGSAATAIALDFDKTAAKQAVAAAGLATATFFETTVGQYASEAALPLTFPLFIKPPYEGGGQGIDANSVVRTFAEYEYKVASLAQTFNGPALVETYLPGREFSVGIFEQLNTSDRLAMPIEVITTANEGGDRILSHQVKKEDFEQTLGITDTALRQRLITFALQAFTALGARDYGRIDIRLDEYGAPHFLEANLVPGVAY